MKISPMELLVYLAMPPSERLATLAKSTLRELAGLMNKRQLTYFGVMLSDLPNLLIDPELARLGIDPADLVREINLQIEMQGLGVRVPEIRNNLGITNLGDLLSEMYHIPYGQDATGKK